MTRRQLSTSCFILEPFTLATLPTVDFGWTFNSADDCNAGSYCRKNYYGSVLRTNKENIGAAADRVLADESDSKKKESYKALMLAVAMQVDCSQQDLLSLFSFLAAELIKQCMHILIKCKQRLPTSCSWAWHHLQHTICKRSAPSM